MNNGDWARPELERLVASRSRESRHTSTGWDGWTTTRASTREAIGRYRARDREGSLVRPRLRQPRALLRGAETSRRRWLSPAKRSSSIGARRRNRHGRPLNLGILLRHPGEAKEAEALLREAAGYEDGLAQTHYQLGVLLEQEGRLDDAVSELTGAATRDPAYAEPHYALARIYRALGRPADAAAALAAFQKLHDVNREAHAQ